jgi:hypothetical protein
MVHLKKAALFLVMAALAANAAALLSMSAATDVLGQGMNMTGNMTKSNTNTTSASASGSGNISGVFQGDGT